MEQCQIYGCLRTQHPEATVTTDISGNGDFKTYLICEFHQDLFQTMDPEWYEIGFTYRGEPEVRLSPFAPSAPVDE